MLFPDSGMNPIKRVVEQSVETRVRSIREKLSIALTFCATVEIEIKYGDINRARYLLQKTQSAIDALAVHIDHSKQISPEYCRVFQQDVARVAERVTLLDWQINNRVRS